MPQRPFRLAEIPGAGVYRGVLPTTDAETGRGTVAIPTRLARCADLERSR